MEALAEPNTVTNTAAKERPTVLSGIQSTGILHLGNYIGALSLWAANQSQYNNLFMVANLHTLTVPEAINPRELRQKSREVAALYIACGIDPDESIIFLQSDVPAHTYLAWILGCCTPVGWLERMTQYKVKAAAQETVGSGLLNYPALQAADILIYKANFVPVGDDQNQHLEITRDIAQRFNHLFGEYFPLPGTLNRTSGARVMGLDDPTQKMSKSIAAKKQGHAIALLDTPAVIKKAIMGAVTDAGGDILFESASVGVKNLLVLYEVLSGQSRPAIEANFAGKGYGALKRELVDLVVTTLEPIQAKFNELMSDDQQLDELLSTGATRASVIANQTVADVRKLVGV
ncbi:MAG: tryptophan--tRNA ligase [Chloroflexi bacterium]|nr:tryptophan--tRNA ligase [Chloroflexota bacterium]MCC6895557.1 tryptophan--tRNA ligase [Anaerolineae bacterium]